MRDGSTSESYARGKPKKLMAQGFSGGDGGGRYVVVSLAEWCLVVAAMELLTMVTRMSNTGAVRPVYVQTKRNNRESIPIFPSMGRFLEPDLDMVAVKTNRRFCV